MDRPVITIVTDASIDERVPIAAWAFCISWPGGKVTQMSNAITKRHVTDSTQAEIIAVANALVVLDSKILNSKYDHKDFRLQLHIDNDGARFHVKAGDDDYSQRSRRFARLNHDIINACKLRLRKYDYEVFAIKSHMPYKRRAYEHRLHAWCDSHSRLKMRTARNLLRKTLESNTIEP